MLISKDFLREAFSEVLCAIEKYDGSLCCGCYSTYSDIHIDISSLVLARDNISSLVLDTGETKADLPLLILTCILYHDLNGNLDFLFLNQQEVQNILCLVSRVIIRASENGEWKYVYNGGNW